MYLVAFFDSNEISFHKLENSKEIRNCQRFSVTRKVLIFERRRRACMQTQIKSEANNDNDKSSPTSNRKGKCNQAKSVTKMKKKEKGLQKRQGTHA